MGIGKTILPLVHLLTERMEQKQATQRHYYNQDATELKPLAVSVEVYVQTKSGKWKSPTVLGQHSTPRYYTVRMEVSIAGTDVTY